MNVSSWVACSRNKEYPTSLNEINLSKKSCLSAVAAARAAALRLGRRIQRRWRRRARYPAAALEDGRGAGALGAAHPEFTCGKTTLK